MAKEDDSAKLKEQLTAVKEEKELLEEELQLRRTNWMYSHYKSGIVLFALAYGACIAVLVYLLVYFSKYWPPQVAPYWLQAVSAILVLFVIPAIGVFLPLFFLKAPKFSSTSLRIYPLTFFFFEVLLLYFDPLQSWIGLPNGQGSERLNYVLPLPSLQFMFSAFASLFVKGVADYSGYKTALNGSALTFEVDAGIDAVQKELGKMTRDFNFYIDSSYCQSEKLYFTRTYRKVVEVLQVFLRSAKEKTDVVLVMHAIKNDVPLRSGREEVVRIGRSLMKWLEVGKGWAIRELENETLVDSILIEAKKSFYRQRLRLPSREVLYGFVRIHWKDIAVVVSIIVAVLSWLFPLRP